MASGVPRRLTDDPWTLIWGESPLLLFCVRCASKRFSRVFEPKLNGYLTAVLEDLVRHIFRRSSELSRYQQCDLRRQRILRRASLFSVLWQDALTRAALASKSPQVGQFKPQDS